MPDLATQLLPWYDENRRDLPWRRSLDPYAIWVSEIMLQQTTVQTAVPYFVRFMARFPKVQDLADAPLDEVLRLWSGLGYYRRARMMHRAARQIVEEHDGIFPNDPKIALSLPGIGRYTMGAILSIAYHRQIPLVDGNVARVLSRVFEIEGCPDDRTTNKELWDLAEKHVPAKAPGDFNQALMELGATICTPRNPICDQCPIELTCSAKAHNRVSEFPRTKDRPQPTAVKMATVLLMTSDELYLRQRGPEEIMGGLFEPLTFQESAEGVESPSLDVRHRVRDRLNSLFGFELERLSSLGMTRHAIMDFRIRTEVFLGSTSKPPCRGPTLVSVPFHKLGSYGMTGMGKKALGLFKGDELHCTSHS